MKEGTKRAIRRIVAALVILAAIGLVYLVFRIFFRPLPAPVEPGDILRLEQGWDDESRRWYYSASQGTLVIPYDWYLALEQPASRQSILADDYVSRFRLIPNPDPQFNPDRLPVGVTKALHPVTGRAWLSFTCAMCHTGQMTYRGTEIRIDGAPSMQDFNAYTQEMILSLALTRFLPARFDRFARRMLGEDYTRAAARELRRELKQFISLNGTRAIEQEQAHIYPTASGFGRVDALGTGANGMMFQLDRANELVANAPVSNPPLWWTHDFDWVQSVAAIEQPLGRNMVEAMGVNAYVDLMGGAGNIAPLGVKQEPGSRPQDLYLSSVELRNMFLMETMLAALQPPSWPERILGPIDWQRVERGRRLYEERRFERALSPQEEQLFPEPEETEPRPGLCARCHAPQLTAPNEYGKRFIKLKMYKLEVIGTSELGARNFAARQVRLSGILRDRIGKPSIGIGEALGTFSSGVQDRRWDDLLNAQGYIFFPGDSRDDIPLYEGFRPNRFRAPLGYPARPLGGYWATAPYLHNGSVTSLYKLLSPVEEREEVFWTGNVEFDPRHVGYRSQNFRGGFKYDTRTDGNSSSGHEFRDAPEGTSGVIGPALSPEERLDIIEYMKVLDDFPGDYLTSEERNGRLEATHWWREGYGPRREERQEMAPVPAAEPRRGIETPAERVAPRSLPLAGEGQ